VRWLRLDLSKGPNTAGVFYPSSENGKRPSFRNVVFSSYLEFRTIDKVHKPSDFVCYTQSSETIIFCVRFEVLRAVVTNVAIFWDIAQCSLYFNRRFVGTHHLHLQGLKPDE
jgi:hypothetical protein